MAEINTYVEVDVVEFIDSCCQYEIDEIIEYLTESGHLEKNKKPKKEPKSLMEEEWDNIINKLSNSRLRLTSEEEEIIHKIANKF